MASFIGNDDFDCSISSLDVFSGTARQEEIVDGYWEYCAPKNSLENTSIEFEIDGNETFIDLQHSYVRTKLRIKHVDGTDLADNEEVSCISYLGSTLYKQVDLHLSNDHVISVNDYHYRAYLETLLSYNETAKKSWLQSGLYYKDTHAHHNTIGDNNQGFKFRKGHFAKSKAVETISKLHCELFNQDRLLLDHIPIKIVLTRNADALCLLTADTTDVKIVIEEVTLVVRRMVLANHIYNDISTRLLKADAKYPISHVKVKAFTRPAGLRNVEIINQLSYPDIPTRLVIGMVSNEAYSGKKKLNPFKFHHYDLVYADVLVNSKSILTKPIHVNMTDKQYMQAYWSLMVSLGYTFKDDGFHISRNEYDNGNFLLGFDLTPTLCNGTYNDPTKTGNVDVELKFSAPLPETISVIVYAQYDNKITINSARKAVSNFK